MTRFTAADVDRANWDWRCSCGPAALTVICDLTLDEVRPMSGSDFPGFTNPTRIFAAMRASGRSHRELRRTSTSEQPWPGWGICRIQWEGPWMAPNNCQHANTQSGKNAPRRWGSWATEVCRNCGAFRTHGHDPGRSHLSAWYAASEYAEATAEMDLD